MSSKSSPFVHQNSQSEYQCGTSMCRGQQDVSSAISSESEHIISVRKTSRFANKSGKNVVSALDHATNSIEKN